MKEKIKEGRFLEKTDTKNELVLVTSEMASIIGFMYGYAEQSVKDRELFNKKYKRLVELLECRTKLEHNLIQKTAKAIFEDIVIKDTLLSEDGERTEAILIDYKLWKKSKKKWGVIK